MEGSVGELTGSDVNVEVAQPMTLQDNLAELTKSLDGISKQMEMLQSNVNTVKLKVSFVKKTR